MRIIIVGASSLGIDLAQILIAKGHEIILIERDPEKARAPSETLDCTVINAEGTKPDILEKAEIEQAEAVVACTDHDQDNILIGLIARTHEVPEIIIKTDDIQFRDVANKLGFHHVVNPSHTTSIIIADALRGLDTIELSTLVRGDVRFTGFIVGERFEGKQIADFELPQKTSFIGIYREKDFFPSSDNPVFQQDDELLFATVTESEKQLCSIFCDEEQVFKEVHQEDTISL